MSDGVGLRRLREKKIWRRSVHCTKFEILNINNLELKYLKYVITKVTLFKDILFV